MQRGVAQLVARSVRDAEVVRSSRITPTRKFNSLLGCFLLCFGDASYG